MPWAEGSAAALPAFSVALHKGSARVATLHVFLSTKKSSFFLEKWTEVRLDNDTKVQWLCI